MEYLRRFAIGCAVSLVVVVVCSMVCFACLATLTVIASKSILLGWVFLVLTVILGFGAIVYLGERLKK